MATTNNITRRTCATPERYNLLMQTNPDFRRRQVELQQATRQRLARTDQPSVSDVVIPVVVHVVYTTEADNIKDEQIESQIEVLNLDYRAQNPDKSSTPQVWQGLVTDAHIMFQLASIDPEGKQTSGITRTQTNKLSFAYELDPIKTSATGGADPWPSDRYLNIWVCRAITLRNSPTVLGYASFPGEPPELDGVVIIHSAFGTKGTVEFPGNNFNLGRTATHEIGHWLNLRHIWGDDVGFGPSLDPCSGSDDVDDTPNQEGPNDGKPLYPHISCSNAPHGDMFVNYMDYVDDDAMFMFTSQQVLRMQVALEQERSTFLPK